MWQLNLPLWGITLLTGGLSYTFSASTWRWIQVEVSPSIIQRHAIADVFLTYMHRWVYDLIFGWLWNAFALAPAEWQPDSTCHLCVSGHFDGESTRNNCFKDLFSVPFYLMRKSLGPRKCEDTSGENQSLNFQLCKESVQRFWSIKANIIDNIHLHSTGKRITKRII